MRRVENTRNQEIRQAVSAIAKKHKAMLNRGEDLPRRVRRVRALVEAIARDENTLRCAGCGKFLSSANPSKYCYVCRWRQAPCCNEELAPVEQHPETLCTSRPTRGYDEVQKDYNGSPLDFGIKRWK